MMIHFVIARGSVFLLNTAHLSVVCLRDPVI
jgi:hypothetical protein